MRSIILLSIALALASCSRGEPTAIATNETDAGLAERTPAPPLPSQPADASQPQPLAALTAEGWGPLRIGMTLQEVTNALGPDSDPAAVGGPEPESCDEFRPERAPPGLLAMMEDGRLTSISLVDKSPVRTDRGLGLGIPAAAVTKVYGASAAITPHKYEDAPAVYMTWWAKGGGSKAYVEDPAARGIRYEVDGSGKVSTIHAGGPSIQYVEGCA